jgi:hypothetical protein
MSYKGSINQITNPNPMYSHLTHDNTPTQTFNIVFISQQLQVTVYTLVQ